MNRGDDPVAETPVYPRMYLDPAADVGPHLMIDCDRLDELRHESELFRRIADIVKEHVVMEASPGLAVIEGEMRREIATLKQERVELRAEIGRLKDRLQLADRLGQRLDEERQKNHDAKRKRHELENQLERESERASKLKQCCDALLERCEVSATTWNALSNIMGCNMKETWQTARRNRALWKLTPEDREALGIEVDTDSEVADG